MVVGYLCARPLQRSLGLSHVYPSFLPPLPLQERQMTATYSFFHQGVCCSSHPPQRQPWNTVTHGICLYWHHHVAQATKVLQTWTHEPNWELILHWFFFLRMGIPFFPVRSPLVWEIACISAHIWETLFDIWQRLFDIWENFDMFPKFSQAVPFN